MRLISVLLFLLEQNFLFLSPCKIDIHGKIVLKSTTAVIPAQSLP